MTGIEKIDKLNEAVKTLRNHCVNVECSECVFCAINGDFEKEHSSAVAYAWFVWEKGYEEHPMICWI